MYFTCIYISIHLHMLIIYKQNVTEMSCPPPLPLLCDYNDGSCHQQTFMVLTVPTFNYLFNTYSSLLLNAQSSLSMYIVIIDIEKTLQLKEDKTNIYNILITSTDSMMFSKPKQQLLTMLCIVQSIMYIKLSCTVPCHSELRSTIIVIFV